MKNERMTKQKRIILEEIRKLKTHPTAEELYAIIKKRLPKISLATVYRNLEKMAEQGIILKLEIPGDPKRFDGFIHNHNHFKCEICQKVYDIEREDLLEYDMIAKKIGHNFKITKIDLILYGICPKCAERHN